MLGCSWVLRSDLRLPLSWPWAARCGALGSSLLALSCGGQTDRGEHCSNRASRSDRIQVCESRACTNSLCPGLRLSEDSSQKELEADLGCRPIADVFKFIQEHAKTSSASWGPWYECIRGIEDIHLSQLEQLRGLFPDAAKFPDVTAEAKAAKDAAKQSKASAAKQKPKPGSMAGVGSSGDSTSEDAPESNSSWPPPSCESDLDCQDSLLGPACDEATGNCAPCRVGSDDKYCKDPDKSRCGALITGQLSCQSCFDDLHCADSPQKAYCQRDHRVGEEVGTRCVACFKAEHCADSPKTPHCLISDSAKEPACVACINDAHCSDAQRPICEDQVCRPCNELDGECKDRGACWAWDAEEGICSETIVYARADGSRCDEADGSRDKPFCELEQALDSVSEGEHTTLRVRGTFQLQRPLIIKRGYKVSILGEESTQIVSESSDPVLRVFPGAQLALSNLRLRAENFESDAVFRCDGVDSRIRLSKVVLEGAGGHGIRSRNCAIRGHAVEILQNRGFGLRQSGGRVALHASVIAANGRSDDADGGAFRLSNGAHLDLRYVTVVQNQARDQPSILRCLTRDDRVEIRNSLIIDAGNGRALRCASSQMQVQHNVSNREAFRGRHGAHYASQRSLEALFRDVSGHNYRLRDDLSPSEDLQRIRSTGRWQPGDPKLDLEGEPYLQKGRSFVGADQAK